MVYSSESVGGPMSRMPLSHGPPLAWAPARRYRIQRGAGFVFVFVCLAFVGLITWGALTQPGGRALIPLYGIVAVLFLPFFLLASRQRAAIYSDGLVPPHRRVGEFLGARRAFLPFRDFERVILVRNELAPSQFLYAQVFMNSGRRETLDPVEVGRDFLQRFVDIAEGRALPGITLRHEYRVEKW